MREDEIRDGIQPCIDVLLDDVIFVVLAVGDSGHILVVVIACEALQPEVVFVWVFLEDITKWVYNAYRALTEV